MKRLQISVTNFVELARRKNHIEPVSPGILDPSHGLLAQEKWIQKNGRQGKAEHSLQWTVEKINIQGRIDFYSAVQKKLYELKATSAPKALGRLLTPDHPYVLQTALYAHMLEQLGTPVEHAYLTIIDIDGHVHQTIDVLQDSEWISDFVKQGCNKVHAYHKDFLATVKRRADLANKIQFPFASYRPGQQKLIEDIETSFKDGKNVLMQAPTGTGKTVTTILPILRNSLKRGETAVFLTPKNSQHKLAEDAVLALRKDARKLRSVTIKAKSKLCLNTEVTCLPELCPFAKDYYSKFEEHKLDRHLAKHAVLNEFQLKKIGRKFEVCPYQLAVDSIKHADLVICDYNYVFSPSANVLEHLTFLTNDRKPKPDVAIDESHNLIDRVLDAFTVRLASAQFNEVKSTCAAHGFSATKQTIELVETTLASLRKSVEMESLKEPLKKLIFSFIKELNEEVPQSAVLQILELIGALNSFVTYLSAEEATHSLLRGPGGSLTALCIKPQHFISNAVLDLNRVIFFSATLKPLKFYAASFGLYEDSTAMFELASPFPVENRRIISIPQISTRWIDRDRHMSRIAATTRKIVETKLGNYVLFFPSFDFLERVFDQFEVPRGFEVLRQNRKDSFATIKSIINDLQTKKGIILFAVQGGSLSEGIDLRDNALAGVVIIGPAIPRVSAEKEALRAAYDQQGLSGYSYAYTYPAIAKSVQAAGRLIRSESDRGIIVLMDDRFLSEEFQEALPSDWRAEAFVKSNILSELNDFWSK